MEREMSNALTITSNIMFCRPKGWNDVDNVTF